MLPRNRDEEGRVTAREYGRRHRDAVYPIVDGELVDVQELEGLLYLCSAPSCSLIFPVPLCRRHVLVHSLELGESLKDVPLLLIIPSSWSRSTRLKLLRMLLEGIGVAGVYLAEAPVMAAFGCATPTALVVDAGHGVCEVTALVDGEPVPGALETIRRAGRRVDERFSTLLLRDPVFMTSIRDWEAEMVAQIEDVARAFRESDVSHPSRNSDVASQPVTFTLSPSEDRTPLAVGDGRGALMDVLFETEGEEPSLIDTVLAVLRRCDADKRPILLDHLVLTGGLSRHPLFKSRFEAALRQRLPVSEFAGDFQSRSFRVRSVPEYYPEIWQRATPLAAWFGGGITAKCVLGDQKNYFTREDLVQHGPRIFRDCHK